MARRKREGFISLFIKVFGVSDGPVNFEHGKKRFELLAAGMRGNHAFQHDNVRIAKMNRYLVGEGADAKVMYVQKISSECIRHQLFDLIYSSGNPEANMHNDTLDEKLSNLGYLLRGDLILKTGQPTIKRASTAHVGMMEAVAHNGITAEPSWEISSNSGPRGGGDTGEDVMGATSMRFTQASGKTYWRGDATLEIGEIGFIPVSEKFDRLSVPPDRVQTFIEKLSRRIGSQVAQPAHYYKRGSTIRVPEEGILLTQEQVMKVVCLFLFEGFRTLQIQRAGACFDLDHIEVKPMYNALTDKRDDPAGYVKVQYPSELPFTAQDLRQGYELADTEEAEELNAEIAESVAENTRLAKERKAQKSAENAERKAKHNADKAKRDAGKTAAPTE